MVDKSLIVRSLICICLISVVLCPITMVALSYVATMSNYNILPPSVIAGNCIYCFTVLGCLVTLLFVITSLFVMCNRSDKRLQTKEAILCIFSPLNAIRHFIQNKNYDNINMIFAMTPFCIIAFFVGYYIYIIMDSVRVAGDISPNIVAGGSVGLVRTVYFIIGWLVINIIYLVRSKFRLHRHY